MIEVFVFILMLLGFAAVHDWKTTFVSDWVVYAIGLLGIGGLIMQGEVYAGLLVVGGMGVVAGLFYYGGVFAQGDARLLVALAPGLFGMGVMERSWYGVSFIGLLLLVGLVYTLGVSGWKAWESKAYLRELKKRYMDARLFFWGFVLLGLVCSFFLSFAWWGALFGGGLCLGLIWIHAKSVEQSCFIVKTSPAHLLLGDWLVQPVRIGNVLLRPSPGGLTAQDIARLRRARLSVLIKQGVPFVPVFFLTYLLMGCVALGGYEGLVVKWVRSFVSFS
jgi:hypothetical protein